jgi:hypothetical protein
MTIEEKQEREKDEMETWDRNILTEEVPTSAHEMSCQ